VNGGRKVEPNNNTTGSGKEAVSTKETGTFKDTAEKTGELVKKEVLQKKHADGPRPTKANKAGSLFMDEKREVRPKKPERSSKRPQKKKEAFSP